MFLVANILAKRFGTNMGEQTRRNYKIQTQIVKVIHNVPKYNNDVIQTWNQHNHWKGQNVCVAIQTMRNLA